METKTLSTDSRTASANEKASAHTPGPWCLDACGDRLFVLSGQAPSDLTVVARIEDRDKGKAEAEANGRLLAAAPDLLAALRWAEEKLAALVTEDVGHGSFIRGTGTELAGFCIGRRKMQAAIAKAESGGSVKGRER